MAPPANKKLNYGMAYYALIETKTNACDMHTFALVLSSFYVKACVQNLDSCVSTEARQRKGEAYDYIGSMHNPSEAEHFK